MSTFTRLFHADSRLPGDRGALFFGERSARIAISLRRARRHAASATTRAERRARFGAALATIVTAAGVTLALTLALFALHVAVHGTPGTRLLEF